MRRTLPWCQKTQRALASIKKNPLLSITGTRFPSYGRPRLQRQPPSAADCCQPQHPVCSATPQSVVFGALERSHPWLCQLCHSVCWGTTKTALLLCPKSEPATACASQANLSPQQQTKGQPAERQTCMRAQSKARHWSRDGCNLIQWLKTRCQNWFMSSLLLSEPLNYSSNITKLIY